MHCSPDKDLHYPCFMFFISIPKYILEYQILFSKDKTKFLPITVVEKHVKKKNEMQLIKQGQLKQL